MLGFFVCLYVAPAIVLPSLPSNLAEALVTAKFAGLSMLTKKFDPVKALGGFEVKCT